MKVYFDLEFNAHKNLLVFTFMREGDKEPTVIHNNGAPLNKEEVINFLKGKHIIGYSIISDLQVLGVKDLSIFSDYDDLFLASLIYFFKDYAIKRKLSLYDVLELANVGFVPKRDKDIYQKFFAELGVENTSLFIPNEALEYAKDDVRFLPLLEKKLEPALKSAYYKKIEKRMLPVVLDMNQRGLPVDIELVEKELQRTQENLAKMEAHLRTTYPQLKTINLKSPQQLIQALQPTFPALKDTSKDTLIELAYTSDYPIFQDLLQYRKLVKTFEYITRIWQQAPRLKGHFLITGAPSGRMACRNENLQQIPRHLRHLIRTDKYLICIDFPQIELRIPAMLFAKEFREVFNQGVDLHITTAQMLYNSQEITKEQRQIAKSFNFGLLYGMATEGLQRYVFINTGTKLSFADAHLMRSRWFQTYKSIEEWHEATFHYLFYQADFHLAARPYLRKTFITPKTIKYPKEYYGSTALGRPYYTTKFTEALNFLIQGTGADLLKVVAGKAFEKGVRFINLVHDEFLCEAETLDEAQWIVQILTETIQEAWQLILDVAKASGWHTADYVSLPIDTEKAIIKSWSEKD